MHPVLIKAWNELNSYGCGHSLTKMKSQLANDNIHLALFYLKEVKNLGKDLALGLWNKYREILGQL